MERSEWVKWYPFHFKKITLWGFYFITFFYDFLWAMQAFSVFFSVELSVESYIMEVKILYNILSVEKMVLLNELKLMNKLRNHQIQRKIFCSQIFPKFYTFFLYNSLIWNLFNFLSYQMHFSIFFLIKIDLIIDLFENKNRNWLMKLFVNKENKLDINS